MGEPEVNRYDGPRGKLISWAAAVIPISANNKQNKLAKRMAASGVFVAHYGPKARELPELWEPNPAAGAGFAGWFRAA
jgi:hypothetical protein